jgi:deoxyribodipyrimidine photo-lyase
MTSLAVPPERIHPCNNRTVDASRDYVLYWMIANRRRHWNFALQRAVHWATELRKPLLIVEALNCDYPWASARFHTAVLEGMRDNLRDFEGAGALYYPFAEHFPSQGSGMAPALAERSCLVVTDDFPAFEIPRWIAALAEKSPVLVEKVDSNGIFPMRFTDRVFTTAHSFRRFLQKELPAHLEEFPLADSLAGVDLPRMAAPPILAKRWPAATAQELSTAKALAAAIPVDGSVAPVCEFAGGAGAGRDRLKRFVRNGMKSYVETRNQPEAETSSGLSPYLHFGHISAHEVFHAVATAVRWSPEKLSPKTTGSREGWWGAGPDAEAFFDQLVTWREIGFNMCAHSPDYAAYGSLPAWARKTLGEHAADPRPVLYSRETLENAATHDVLWNAAQSQLLTEGRIHNYLRMLWGKKILEWSQTPEEALETMIDLNNKYALDGRDPNSYTGIFWILGRYDRPWAPQRPIFGNIRYMSSANAARKLRVKDYIARYTKEHSI